MTSIALKSCYSKKSSFWVSSMTSSTITTSQFAFCFWLSQFSHFFYSKNKTCSEKSFSSINPKGPTFKKKRTIFSSSSPLKKHTNWLFTFVCSFFYKFSSVSSWQQAPTHRFSISSSTISSSLIMFLWFWAWFS
jgi:hypothetical protein